MGRLSRRRRIANTLLLRDSTSAVAENVRLVWRDEPIAYQKTVTDIPVGVLQLANVKKKG